MHSKIDITKIREDDAEVWNMIGEGRVKGCFQIESYLGKTWSKKSKPKNITELSALISIVRPGTLKAIVDGKSMTQHFVDRKFGKEDIPSLHPLIDDLLKETYGVIVYQEQAMEISVKMAGFNLKQADDLRKAIGKKKADLMKEVRVKFIEGCKNNNIDEDKAIEIFDMIEKSARYSFNKCLDPSSVVQTKDGYKLLSEIVIGDYVLAPTDNEDKFIKVLDVIDCGDKELYEIELDSGDKISCTLDHKFLCSNGKKYSLEDIIELNLEIMVYN